MRAFLFLAVLTIVAGASLAALSVAQTTAAANEAPPNLSGIWRRTYQVSNILDPPPTGPGPIVQDPRYPKVDHNGGPRRQLSVEERRGVIRFTQSWIPDPKNPILKPHTRTALEKNRRTGTGRNSAS